MVNQRLVTKITASTLALFCFSVPAKQMRFDEAWQTVQQNNNSLAAQRANIEHYKQNQYAKNSLNYPTVTVGATYTHLDQDVTLSGDDLVHSLDSTSAVTVTALLGQLGLSGITNATSTIAKQDILHSSINAVWPIYTGGRISSAQQVASGQTDEAIANLKMETLQRYEDLSRYYFSVILAKAVVDTRKSVEKGLSKHRDFALKLEAQGQIAKVERLQAEASLDHAIVERKSSEKDLEIATSALTEILNESETVVPETPLFINKSLPAIDAFIEQTLENYPGLDILNAKAKQANSLIKIEKGSYHPEVYLYGNYTLYEGDELANELTPDWLVGVGVSVPLIDNSGRGNRVQAAKSSLLQVNHLKAQSEQDLTVLVQRTYSQAEQAIETVIGLESSLELANENLRLRSKAFNQGLSTSLDVVDAELYLANIKTQQLAAKYNYMIAVSSLLALSNQTDTFNQYELNAYQPHLSEESL